MPGIKELKTLYWSEATGIGRSSYKIDQRHAQDDAGNANGQRGQDAQVRTQWATFTSQTSSAII